MPGLAAGQPRPVKQGTTLFKNARVVATFSDLGDVNDGALYVEGNVIKWVGATSDLPAEFQQADEVSLQAAR
jgi:cytosine/adenosine deaminase-related metal-dependent hydrolase